MRATVSTRQQSIAFRAPEPTCLITVDNGINARAAVRLAQRLGIDVVVIDHHRIQEQVDTTTVWSDAFCGAGLAAMFAWALALKAGWKDTKVDRLLSGCSQYAAIASIADCVSLQRSTPTLGHAGSRRTLPIETQGTARVAQKLLH